MRETTYEGTIAKVPYAYDRILMEEYEEKALVVTNIEGLVPDKHCGSLSWLSSLIYHPCLVIAGIPLKRSGKSCPKRTSKPELKVFTSSRSWTTSPEAAHITRSV